MNLKIYIILAAVFFCLWLLQVSFFPYFTIMGTVPNLIFIFYFLIISFENRNEFALGLFATGVAGFFLDIVSPFTLGASTGVLLAIYGLNKFIMYHVKERRDSY